MSLKRSPRLLASAAVTAGLAFSGLTLAAPAADAASTTAMYTCKPNLPAGSLPSPLDGLLPTSFKVPATFSAETLPAALTANVPVPAGTPIVGSFDFSDIASGGLAGLLANLGFTLQNGLSTGLTNVPGSAPVAVPINGAFTQVNNGVATFSGQLGAFTPGAGDLPIPVPTSFDASTVLGAFGALFSCSLDNPGGTAPIAVLHANKQGAKIKAHAKAKAGHKAVVTVKVKTSAGQKGVGKVKAKVAGHKAVTKALKNGKVRFVLKGLKLGKNKIKLRFLGNSYTASAKKKVSVKVAR